MPSWVYVVVPLALLAVLAAVGVWLNARSPSQQVDAASTATRVVERSSPGPTSTLRPSPTQLPATSTAGQVSPTTDETLPLPDVSALSDLMLTLINQDRAANGLTPVAWDATAAAAGQAHAAEMAENGYMSHWNLAGYGPDYRYSQAGGLDVAQENVSMYWLRYDDGQPAPIEDWEEVVRQAQAGLMESTGHRANILNPDHTHVGIGLAYHPATGDARIAQEFVNHYIELDALPLSARPGNMVSVRGRLLPGSTEPLVNLAYEPFPSAMSVDDLAATNTYASPAEICDIPTVAVDQDVFSAEVTLDCEGQVGLYHVRVWVEAAEQMVPAANVVIEVR